VSLIIMHIIDNTVLHDKSNKYIQVDSYKDASVWINTEHNMTFAQLLSQCYSFQQTENFIYVKRFQQLHFDFSLLFNIGNFIFASTSELWLRMARIKLVDASFCFLFPENAQKMM